MAQQTRILLQMKEMWVQSLGQEDPLEKEMTARSRIVAWKKSHEHRGLTDYGSSGHKEPDTS